MKCPSCNASNDRVVDTRTRRDGIYRRRECITCGIRWSTCEVIVEDHSVDHSVLQGVNLDNAFWQHQRVEYFRTYNRNPETPTGKRSKTS